MADWKDILSGKEEELKEDDLIKYLEGDLSEEEKNEIEHKISSSSFSNDAVEGLQEFKDKKDLQQYVEQLNKNLKSQLNARKLRKQKRKIKDYPWILIAVLVILVLCIAGYAVIRMHKGKSQPPVQRQNVSRVDHLPNDFTV